MVLSCILTADFDSSQSDDYQQEHGQNLTKGCRKERFGVNTLVKETNNQRV